jgi:hypothetical protein
MESDCFKSLPLTWAGFVMFVWWIAYQPQSAVRADSVLLALRNWHFVTGTS